MYAALAAESESGLATALFDEYDVGRACEMKATPCHGAHYGGVIL